MTDGSASHMAVDVRRVGPAAVVHIRGSVGMAEAEHLKTALEGLAAQAVPSIVLDVVEMDFICSTGLGAIISAHVKCRHHAGQIRFVSPQPAVMQLLETTCLTRLFQIYATVDEALKA